MSCVAPLTGPSKHEAPCLVLVTSRADVPAARSMRRAFVWPPAVFLLAAGATFSSFYVRAGSATERHVPPPAPAAENLGLEVQTEGSGLLLHWDRNSRAVTSAASGALEIDDGATHRELALDRSQVVSGSIFYRPASNDVAFRLDLREPAGPHVSQILRVLDALPRATAPTTIAAASPAVPTKPPAHEPEPTPDTAGASTPRTLNLPPVAIEPAATTSAPHLAPAPTAADPGKLGAASAASQDVLQQAFTGGSLPVQPHFVDFVPPRAIRWVKPGMQTTEPIDVKVRVKIDESGHVTSAHALMDGGAKRDKKLLASAAATVRQWTFEPAKSRGANVAIEETIVIHFGPDAQ